MQDGSKRRACTAAVLALALALPITSPLRELSRGSSRCPLDLELAIERVFDAPTAARAASADSITLGDVALQAMAEHGVASEGSEARRQSLLPAWAVLPDPHEPAPARPLLRLPVAPDAAPRPCRAPCTTPPPVRGPPQSQV